MNGAIFLELYTRTGAAALRLRSMASSVGPCGLYPGSLVSAAAAKRREVLALK